MNRGADFVAISHPINTAITLNRNLQEHRIEEILTRLRRIYLAFIVLAGVFLPFELIGFEQSNLPKIVGSAVGFGINGTVYIGLRRRRSWVIPLVLVTSAFGFFWAFCSMMDPAGDIWALFRKAFCCLLMFFFGYQISFFTKPQVRLFFGTKGQVLF